GVALSILGMSFVGVIADRRLAHRTDKFQEIIRALSDARSEVEASRHMVQQERSRLQTAINNMSQGLLLFDSAERIEICNRRYIEIYGLSSDVVKPGCSFRQLIEHRRDTGSFRGDVGDYHEDLRSRLRTGRATQNQIELPDGRSIQIVNQPLADGGW